MTDDSIEANAIEIDHNAMLESDPSQNKAFLKIFGRFSGHSTLDAPAAATQLSEITPKPKHIHRRRNSHSALKRLNEKLAERMQSQLTVTSEPTKSSTPKLLSPVAGDALKEEASTSKLPSPATLDALDMIDKKSHLLPKKLRTEFIIDTGKKVLKKNFPSLKVESSRRTIGHSHASVHGDTTLAGKADDNLLTARQSHMTTAELVQQAAMQQMHQLSAAAPAVLPARPTQLAARPALPYQQYGYAPAPQYAGYAPALAATPYQLPPAQQSLYRPTVSPQGYYPQQPMQPTYYAAAPAAAAPQAQYAQYPHA
jgi:hypothetical protein